MRKVIPYGVLLVATLVPLFSLGLSNHGLWTADEPRVAEVGREMAVTGNWAVPTLNQKPFLEKPPLYFWSLAATFTAFDGASDTVARIPSAVFGFGGALAVFFLTRMLFGPRVGFLSAFILATSFEYFRVAHWVLVDSALACFVVSAMTLFMAGYLSEKKRRRLLSYLLFYLFCGLAFLSKGFVGLAFPGLGILVFLLFERDLQAIRDMRLLLGAAVFLAVCLPWFLTLWREGGGEYLRVFLVKNNLQRFLPGGTSGHHRPLYYYLGQFPGSFLPWSLLLVPVLYRSFSRSQDLPATPKRGLLFMKSWFVSGFIFLSLASTKRGIYLLPILAPIAVLTAHWIDYTLGSRHLGWVERIFLWVFVLIILGAGLIVIPLDFYFSRELVGSSLAHSILIVGLSVGALQLLRKMRMGSFWICSYSAIFSVLIFLLLWIIPTIDRYKSFFPFCQKVTEAVGDNRSLYAYRPDETLLGVIPFYTGRYVEESHDRNLLQEVLEREDRVFVVAMDKRGTLERELLSTGRAYLLVRQKVGARRICVLFTNRADEGF